MGSYRRKAPSGAFFNDFFKNILTSRKLFYKWLKKHVDFWCVFSGRFDFFIKAGILVFNEAVVRFIPNKRRIQDYDY
jgi:hypothetical protein